jgi:hypothetical protein
LGHHAALFMVPAAVGFGAPLENGHLDSVVKVLSFACMNVSTGRV